MKVSFIVEGGSRLGNRHSASLPSLAQNPWETVNFKSRREAQKSSKDSAQVWEGLNVVSAPSLAIMAKRNSINLVDWIRRGGGVSLLPSDLIPGYNIDFVSGYRALTTISFDKKIIPGYNFGVWAGGHIPGFGALICSCFCTLFTRSKRFKVLI